MTNKITTNDYNIYNETLNNDVEGFLGRPDLWKNSEVTVVKGLNGIFNYLEKNKTPSDETKEAIVDYITKRGCVTIWYKTPPLIEVVKKISDVIQSGQREHTILSKVVCTIHCPALEQLLSEGVEGGALIQLPRLAEKISMNGARKEWAKALVNGLLKSWSATNENLFRDEWASSLVRNLLQNASTTEMFFELLVGKTMKMIENDDFWLLQALFAYKPPAGQAQIDIFKDYANFCKSERTLKYLESIKRDDLLARQSSTLRSLKIRDKSTDSKMIPVSRKKSLS